MGGGKRKQRKRSSGNKGKKQKVVGDDSEKIQKLLEPYSKEQVMEFLCDAAVGDSSVLERIQSMADQDVSHRKIFVHGLAWNTTSETLYAAFDSYGEIQECNLVVDRATGRAKGYGFILYKTRSAAEAALEQPQKNINNRITHCQLASAGPLTTTSSSSSSSNNDNTARKIYVSNVHADVNPDKLRTFFSKFGDIEMGPLGFDTTTGKSRGFALFIYKTIDAANKAIEEPYKMFQGHQLHCQRASDNKNKNKASLHQQAPPVLAAIAAAQNLAIFQHHPTLNPVYASASHGLGILGGNPSIYGAYTINPSLQQPTNTSLTGYTSYI